MSTNLLYNFFGATAEMDIQVSDLGFKKIHEVPPIEFLARKVDPWRVSEIGLRSYLDRIDKDGLDPHYEADYEKFAELIGSHAQESFNSRRGVIRVMQQTKPMGSISMWGVPRLIQGQTNDYMAQLGNMVDVCSVAFYRKGDSEKGMHQGGTKKAAANMQYAAQWSHKPMMVIVSPLWRDENKNFHMMSYTEQQEYLDMLYIVNPNDSKLDLDKTEPIRIDSLYCWSNSLRLLKNAEWEKHVIGVKSQQNLEEYLLAFLEVTRDYVNTKDGKWATKESKADEKDTVSTG